MFNYDLYDFVPMFGSQINLSQVSTSLNLDLKLEPFGLVGPNVKPNPRLFQVQDSTQAWLTNFYYFTLLSTDYFL